MIILKEKEIQIWGDMNNKERLSGETARDYAFRVLKDNIVSLELKPGTLVSENEIAMELGLSRTPVREAIIDLSKASIIEIYPQRGSYVALIDPKMVEEARFLRRILDCAVIEVACEQGDPNILSRIEENLSLQDFYLIREDAAKIFELDNEFHRLIYMAAHKEIVFDMRSSIMIHFDRVRTLSMESVKDMKIVADHHAMYNAILAHDKENAVEMVEKHLARYSVDEYKIREVFPQYFVQ